LAGNSAYAAARGMGARENAAKKFANNAAKTAEKSGLAKIDTLYDAAELNSVSASATAVDVAELEGKPKKKVAKDSENAAAYAAASSVEMVKDGSKYA